MTEPTLDTLARRLERLERQNRRLKQWGVLVVLAVGAVALMGQTYGPYHFAPPGGTFAAEAFHLRDKNGAVVGSLQVSSEGTPELRFWRKIDSSLDVGMVLATESDGESTLHLWGKHDNRVSLGAGPIAATVGVAKRGKIRVMLTTSPSDRRGGDGLYLTDKDDRLLVSLTDNTDVGQGGPAGLMFWDPLTEKRKAAFYIARDGHVGLGLNDRAGKPLVGWVVTPDGKVGNLRPSP